MSDTTGESVQPMDKWVGARIRARRAFLSMSMERLGGILGVKRQQVEKWEKGISRITCGRLHEVAIALNIRPGWFFDEFPLEGQVPTNGAPDLDAVLAMPDGILVLRHYAPLTPAERDAVLTVMRSMAANRPIPTPSQVEA